MQVGALHRRALLPRMAPAYLSYLTVHLYSWVVLASLPVHGSTAHGHRRGNQLEHGGGTSSSTHAWLLLHFCTFEEVEVEGKKVTWNGTEREVLQDPCSTLRLL